MVGVCRLAQNSRVCNHFGSLQRMENLQDPVCRFTEQQFPQQDTTSLLPDESLILVVSSSQRGPAELPVVTGRNRRSHPEGRPGPHGCRQSHGRYREDWALRGEGCSHAALWQVGEETLSTLELPLLLWILSATCGNKQGSLGCMYTQSVCLHHIQKRVDWCDSRNSQTPSHQFN